MDRVADWTNYFVSMTRPRPVVAMGMVSLPRRISSTKSMKYILIGAANGAPRRGSSGATDRSLPRRVMKCWPMRQIRLLDLSDAGLPVGRKNLIEHAMRLADKRDGGLPAQVLQ